MSSHRTQLCWVHTPFSHENVCNGNMTLYLCKATCTFVIVERNVHCVSTNTDGSEASLGVGMVIRTIEKLEGAFGNVILLCVHVCVYHTVTLELMLLIA